MLLLSKLITSDENTLYIHIHNLKTLNSFFNFLFIALLRHLHNTPSGREATPSYFENKSLATLSHTNINISWQNTRPQATYSLWFTISDVFDRADTLSALNLIEEGVGTPGRKATLGFRMSL